MASTVTGAVPLWINGEEVTATTTFDIKSPSTGDKLWTSSSASTADARQACEAATNALKTWRKTKSATIQRILLKAAELMEERHQDLKDIMMQETGALEAFTDFNIVTTIENLRDCAGRAANIQGVIPAVKQEGQGAFVFKEPYGVILGMAPWNAPYILGARAWLYPIVAGNTVVFKGSELSPRTFWAMGKILKDAGLPDGVVNMIYCKPGDAAEVTNFLIEHPAIKKVNFTGSTHVGSIIAAKAGKECKPCLMELGGKASAIVCEDADVEHAAMQAAVGAFLHAGQICKSPIIVLIFTHGKISSLTVEI
jgi:acyl-CoA reductase-like NAD-dependent aldehyde dehydrogenase